MSTSWPVRRAPVRWGLVAVTGALVTLGLTVLLAITVFGILFSYGLGLFLLPVPLAVGAGVVALGAVGLQQAHVASPHATSWLLGVLVAPLLTLAAIFVPVEVTNAVLADGETHPVVWVVWMGLLASGLGAAAWCAAVAITDPNG